MSVFIFFDGQSFQYCVVFTKYAHLLVFPFNILRMQVHQVQCVCYVMHFNNSIFSCYATVICVDIVVLIGKILLLWPKK